MRAIDAIREGGISVLEITMTVPGAVARDRGSGEDVMGMMHSSAPERCSIRRQRERVSQMERSLS